MQDKGENLVYEDNISQRLGFRLLERLYEYFCASNFTNRMRRSLYVAVVCIVVVLTCAARAQDTPPPPPLPPNATPSANAPQESMDTSEAQFTEEQLQSYYEVYKDPAVKHLRTELDRLSKIVKKDGTYDNSM